MITLKVEKRNPEVKAKKLRRDGFVCGVLYGKEMKVSPICPNTVTVQNLPRNLENRAARNAATVPMEKI